VQLSKELKPDKPKRLDFVTGMHLIGMDSAFHPSILFSDEATFRQSGKFSRHNTRVRGSKSFHFHREVVRDGPKMNVWCGSTTDGILGPFFAVNVTVLVPSDRGFAAEHYLPTGWGSPTLEFARSRNPHKNFPRSLDLERRINVWPPRFTGIHTTGFIFVGYVKDRVCATRVPDLLTLQDRIVDVIASVTQGMVDKKCQEIVYRLDIIRVASGSRVEVY
jgi:hypothetical protein